MKDRMNFIDYGGNTNDIIIKTSAKLAFVVEWEVAQQSQIIRKLLDDLKIKEGGGGENKVYLINEEITCPIFDKIWIWMEKNRGKPDFQPEDEKNESKDKNPIKWDQLDLWEKSYLTKMLSNVDDMHRLLNVANFMEIKGLINLMTTAINILSRSKKTAIIETADEETVHVDYEVVRQSQTIRIMLDDLNITEAKFVYPVFIFEGENTLPLTEEEVTGPIFKKALIWMEKNRSKPDFQPDDENKSKDEISTKWNQLEQWEQSYLCDMTAYDDMHRLLIAADILKINGLINLLTIGIHILFGKKFLFIKTADEDNFHVEWEVAQQSQTIRNMLDGLNITEAQLMSPDGGNTLSLTNEEITGSIFKKALIWMEKNRGKPDFQPEDVRLKRWERTYLPISVDETHHLLIVANFLKIKGLIDLMKKAVYILAKKTIVFKIADKETFHVEWEDARHCRIIWTMLDGLNITEDNQTVICLPTEQVTGPIFKQTLIWMEKKIFSKKTLIIKTADKETFYVEWEVARQSQTIRNMLDDLNITEARLLSPDFKFGDENILRFITGEITGSIFRKALTWMKMNRNLNFQTDDKKDEAKKDQENRKETMENKENACNIQKAEGSICFICGVKKLDLGKHIRVCKPEKGWDQLEQWEKLYLVDMMTDYEDRLFLLNAARSLEIKGLIDLMKTAIAFDIQG